jgi:threonine synthase
MGRANALRCVVCGKEFPPDYQDYTCDVCGLDGTLDVLYDYDSIRWQMNRGTLEGNSNFSMWRYEPVLPADENSLDKELHCGFTMLYESHTLAERLGVRAVFVKDETRNPTLSLKDRASAVAVRMAEDLRRYTIACSSTGNAASSLAGFAAVTKLKSYIFVPETAPQAKITQLLVYGANVILVRGDYKAAFDLSTAAIERYGWYNRNCAINPYLVEGKKTCGMEIAEQLSWDLPDRIFISVGDGCCLSGLYKAFYDLAELGMIDRMPHLHGVQAVGCQPIHKAFVGNRDSVEFGPADTIADSIAVGAPRNWSKALRALRRSGGGTVTVTDDEILEAITLLARETGVFGEPAGVAGFAGALKMARMGSLGEHERIAVVVTGNGLKDIVNAQKSAGNAITVDPDIEQLEKVL